MAARARQIEGVTAAEIDRETLTLALRYDPAVTDEARLEAAVDEIIDSLH